ncbi:MAG: hypothetical protein IOC72_10370, partial [Rhodobacter sp.]|nr:hypothetical protein [Rhodobacter sp.]
MTDAALLCLTQWLSPAFPAGSRASSRGLEWAISEGDVTTAARLRCWIAAVLTKGAGRTDAILLAQALRPQTGLADLAALAQALALSRERLAETPDQGRALGRTIAALTGRTERAMPYPVALGGGGARSWPACGAYPGGVETGGCPHVAIRKDASINLAAVADLNRVFPDPDVILIENGGNNLAATFGPELADLSVYVIDTAAGQDIPRKCGPWVTRSDLRVIGKIDLAPWVGVDPALRESDARAARGARPFVMAGQR